MSVNQIGIRQSNVFLPYTAATKRTKWLVFDQAAGNYSVTSSVANWSVSGRCAVMFYADSNGAWHMRFNLRGGYSAGTPTTHDLTFNSVVFKTGTYQSITAYNAAGTAYGFTNSAASTITATGSAAANWGLSGDVELNAEPTAYTTAANMEGVLAADVFIPPAAAGIAGLVNNTAGNTVGTPILGRTDGQAVAAGDVGECIPCNNVSGTYAATSTINPGTEIGNGTQRITLTKGRYRVDSVIFIAGITSTNVDYAFTLSAVSGSFNIVGSCSSGTLKGSYGTTKSVQQQTFIIDVSSDTVIKHTCSYSADSSSATHFINGCFATRLA